jgi:regulator of protease activity HflC (stomatin/prohibitin superfamily)
VADQWDRAVILRLGKFRALKGPGLFFIIPVIDAIPYWIDTRVITTGFKAEKTLTKDTVPGLTRFDGHLGGGVLQIALL